MALLPWRRATAAQRAAASNVPAGGQIIVETDTGNVAGTDGTTPWSALKRLTRVDEVTTAVQQYVSSIVVTNSSLVGIAAESGYVWALVDANGRIALGVTPSGQVIGKISLAAGVLTAAAFDAPTATQLAGVGAGSQVQSLTPEQAGQWAYVITGSSGRIAFGIQSDGSIVMPKFTLPAGSVDTAQLSATLQGAVAQAEPVEAGFLWSVVDAGGRVGLGLKPDGTLYAPKTSFAAYSLRSSDNGTYLAQPFVDSSNRTQFRVIRKADGQITFTTSGASNSVEPVATPDNHVVYRTDASGVMADVWRPAEGGTVWAEVARAPIYCPGDSLTQGAGLSNSANAYPAILAATLGVTAANDGIGGQNVQQITARANADPALLTVTGNSIPSSGSVAVTACTQTSTGAALQPLAGPTANTVVSRTGTLAGVHGTLADANDTGHTTTFAPDAGSATTPCPAGTPFVFDTPLPLRDATWSIMMGRNNLPNGASQSTVVSTITAAVASTITAQKAHSKRFVVLAVLPFADRDSITGGSSTGWDRSNLLAVNAALQAAYPNSFIDLMAYLQSNQAAVDAGITYTSQDLTDISNGLTPTSFRSDVGHLNDIGYPLVGRYVANFMRSKGWYS